MKDKQKTKPTKKKLLTYYLVMGACLLVMAALTVGLVFGLQPSKNPVIDDGEQNNPPVIENPDDNKPEEKPPVIDTSSQYEFIAPVKAVTVSQAQVLWQSKTSGWFRLHKGMDFACAAGTEVLAAVDGKVTKVYGNDQLFGGLIEIQHADGVKTVYKFVNPAENLKAGDKVNRGDVIATVATATGNEIGEGDHLHFEVYKNDVLTDPDIYLKLITK